MCHTNQRTLRFGHTHTPATHRYSHGQQALNMSEQPTETHSQGLGSGLTLPSQPSLTRLITPSPGQVFLPSHRLPSPAGDPKCSIQSSLLSCPLGDLSHSQGVQSILCIEDSQTHTQANQTPTGCACVSDGSTQILMDLSNQPPEMELKFPTSCSPA